jgi:hypothetical protein
VKRCGGSAEFSGRSRRGFDGGSPAVAGLDWARVQSGCDNEVGYRSGSCLASRWGSVVVQTGDDNEALYGPSRSSAARPDRVRIQPVSDNKVAPGPQSPYARPVQLGPGSIRQRPRGSSRAWVAPSASQLTWLPVRSGSDSKPRSHMVFAGTPDSGLPAHFASGSIKQRQQGLIGLCRSPAARPDSVGVQPGGDNEVGCCFGSCEASRSDWVRVQSGGDWSGWWGPAFGSGHGEGPDPLGIRLRCLVVRRFPQQSPAGAA